MIAAPEIWLVKTPDVKLAVVPVTVVPVTVVNPAVSPVITVPLNRVKTPEVKLDVVPVTVTPLKVPLILTPDEKNPDPSTERLPETVRLF